MIKRSDTDHQSEHHKSLTADYYRDLCRRELALSGQQLRAILAGLGKAANSGVVLGGARHD
ncbi:hypothetical protein AB4876_01365 [Zhongshania guokunii]|uniref:Uncharacterized protein n=1 Tax=Zhongshania guokunii TaxID=641783 RepID=A0ABV3U0X1_9GAMM